MATMEKELQLNEVASSREIDMSAATPNGQAHDPSNQKMAVARPVKKDTSKKLMKQTLGTCKTCGYMSSQEICKACTLLEGLNKNRPKMEIEIDVEEEESSTLRRRMEGVALAAG
jgi:cytoplasmic tRNA 2-thiolation protein 1